MIIVLCMKSYLSICSGVSHEGNGLMSSVSVLQTQVSLVPLLLNN